MKIQILSLLAFFASNILFAQTTITTTSQIGYVGPLAVANAATAATVPYGTLGTGVTWDCSNLMVDALYPIINFSVLSPAGTMYAADYPTSNWYFTDPAIANLFGHHYYIMSNDSLVLLGEHTPGNSYEIYDDPELDLIFPMAYSQTVNNTYSKTNYLANGNVSSYQTGDITLTYEGNGTLILPTATYTDVAKLKSVRTNSLGPTTTSYLWVNATTGERLMMVDNVGTNNVVFKSDAPTQLQQTELEKQVSCISYLGKNVLLNSVDIIDAINVFNQMGQKVYSNNTVAQNNVYINLSQVNTGIYFISIKIKENYIVKKVMLN